MRPLIVTTFLTLDGVMEDPAWTFDAVPFDEAAYEMKGREQEQAGALLFGRQSYTEFSPVWPDMAEFERYNSLPKYVVSTTLDADAVAADPWGNVTLLRSLDEVAALKETEGDQIQVHGSGTLARSLAAAGLVDSYHLLVFPLLLGSGKRLFADGAPRQGLELTESATYANGVQKMVLEVRR